MADDDKVEGGNINLMLKELMTQLKEVVAQRTTNQAFMEGLVQHFDALEQRPALHHLLPWSTLEHWRSASLTHARRFTRQQTPAHASTAFATTTPTLVNTGSDPRLPPPSSPPRFPASQFFPQQAGPPRPHHQPLVYPPFNPAFHHASLPPLPYQQPPTNPYHPLPQPLHTQPTNAVSQYLTSICPLPYQHLGAGSGSVVPRFHKLDFPTYDGSIDPLGWLHRCEQYFQGQLTEEADKVWTAAYHLVDNAQ